MNSTPALSRAYEWCFQAQKYSNLGHKVHEWFKLGLCDGFEVRRARESELINKYKSQTALPPVKGEECENLVANFLRSIKESVDSFFGLNANKKLKNFPRDYIITVPALWDHAVQDKTLRCAERAGMGDGSQLQVTSEPEAACLYATQTMVRLDENETYVICDADGGTVDVASYTVKFLPTEPLCRKLEMAATPSGGLYGSIFLNRIFEKYLQEKFADYPGWEPSFIEESLRKFEEVIKPEFTGENVEDASVWIEGLVPSRRHGVKKNLFTFTTAELRENVFDEVITKVQGLVRDQISHTKGKVNSVILAGRFGRNLYLKKKIEETDNVIKDGIIVEQIDNSCTAIARDALAAGFAGMGIIGHDDGSFNVISTMVLSRVAGRNYGTKAYHDFREGRDPESRRQVEIREDGNKIKMIQWFTRKGASIRDGEPMSFEFRQLRRVRPGIPAHKACKPVIHIYACEQEIPMKYEDDENVSELVSFQLDLHGLNIPTIQIGSTEFHQATFTIKMSLNSASLSFCGVYVKGTPDEKRFPAEQVQFQ
ncbi:uncharacterized protein TRUGW13939_11618 [Talaromyces rugulosus]|uniref:Uncharacterized protein n=1 Tax=Talaromyces rugulosus TaxID=121627 RepID=A0A7H8RDD7_TALRU|nr:uncharacterized protein TRUGW13939_11618 [Talaromyces rugulosus]QKX64444.1 hypothetical protein TRUGW13939_11618 [Talaromyces rugulosus]